MQLKISVRFIVAKHFIKNSLKIVVIPTGLANSHCFHFSLSSHSLAPGHSDGNVHQSAVNEATVSWP